MTASGTADYTTIYDYNDADGNYTTLLQKEIKTVKSEAETASASVLASNPAEILNIVSSGSETEETVYSYDANGNQITKETSEKTETYTYDGLNRLIGFTDGDIAASYAYNVSGLRIEKTVDGETINHVWDGSEQIVADVVDNDFYEADCYLRGTNLVAKYNYCNGVKSEYTYYTQNAHGDVVNLTDETGAVTKSYTYDAFGVEQNIDDSDTNAFRYCGEYFDAETGTVYLRARYYDPSIGRFISRDSYAGDNNDPLSLNLYTYCHNNPIVFVDPSGHLVWPGQIHDAVQNYIVYGSPDAYMKVYYPMPTEDTRDLVKEVKISYGKDAEKYFGRKSGRADIVDKITGEFWEVKSNYSGKGLTEAQHDVIGYTMSGNKYKSKSLLEPNFYTRYINPNAESVYGTMPIAGGYDEKMNGNFEYRAGPFEYYNVSFWQPEDGVILYDYSKKELSAEEIAYETLLVFLMAAGAAYSGGGVGQPVPAF